jgi:hypothetical protein
MAKLKPTLEMPADDDRTPAKQGRVKPRPAYVLSLSLENIRCFGAKQTLDLSDGDGKPAQWTVILGLNGTGKTTTLQSLVLFEALRVSPLQDLELQGSTSQH